MAKVYLEALCQGKFTARPRPEGRRPLHVDDGYGRPGLGFGVQASAQTPMHRQSYGVTHAYRDIDLSTADARAADIADLTLRASAAERP